MQLTISSPRKGRLRIVGKTGDSPTFRDTFSPDSVSERKRIGRATGLTDKQLLQFAETFDKNPKSPDVEVTVAGQAVNEFRCVRRLINDTSGVEFVGEPLATFVDAFKSAESPDTVIEWGDHDRLAVLDIDYHDRPLDSRPDNNYLYNALARVQPSPSLVWASKGRGLHCVYHDCGGFTAGELAACGGLAYLGVDPTATFEVISRTRVSPDGRVQTLQQTSDLPALAHWLRNSVSDEQIDAWLLDNGYARGESYTHDQCPMASHVESHGKPVFIGDGGVFCHKCSSLGVVCGSRKAGYFTYASLIRGGVPSVVRSMGENFTHWDHAKLVLADAVRVGGATAELAYRALLKLVHGANDRRVATAFVSGSNLVRLDNRWATRDAVPAYDKFIQPILATLPACQTIDGKVIGERVTRFNQRIDLSEYGYPAVTPIRGLRIYSHRLGFADVDRISVVVPSGVLRSPSMERYRPRYVPSDRRITDPWAVVEESLPGVNKNFVRLLVAAKGVAEGQVGLPPYILVSGPTASGKSLMVTLAAALAGDHNTEMQWKSSDERMRQSVMEGIDNGSYVTINEIFKDANRGRKNEVEALDFFLNLTPNSVSHKLYVGPVPLGRCPVGVVTDVGVPQVLRNDEQLARRFVYVRLDDSHKEWVDTTVAAGLYDVSSFRTYSERHAQAADAIVSEVIDDFFQRPMPLAEIAKQLGYTLLTDATDFDDPSSELRKFFDAVDRAEALPEKWQKRWPGRGWKLIQVGEETELADAWECVNDGQGEKWFESRRCAATGWRKMLKRAHDVKFESRRFRTAVVVRFRQGSLGTEYKVNGEVV